MTELDRARIAELAGVELRSTQTLVSDPQCELATAMPHLLRAWQALAWLSRSEVPEAVGEHLGAFLSPAHLALIRPAMQAKILASLRAAEAVVAAPAPWTAEANADELTLPTARSLIRELRAARKLIRAIQREAGGRALRTQRALRWAGRISVGAVVATAVVLVVLRPWQADDIGPWRAAYYPTEDLTGEPEIRHEIDVNFDWNLEPPTESIPSDNFSARFDTCLLLDEATDAAFILTADDGARLFIDGKQRINQWKRSGSRSKGAKLELRKGTHHIRVEYRERESRASVHLDGSFDKAEAPGPIPAHMLAFPKGNIDAKRPCKGVR